MVEYSCPRCDYTTKNRSYILKHLERKNICLPVRKDISIDDCFFLVFNCSRKRVQEVKKCVTNVTKSNNVSNNFCVTNTSNTDLVENFVKRSNKSNTNLTNVGTEKKVPFIQAVSRNDRICRGCNREFKHKNSLYRHVKHFCKTPTILDDADNPNFSTEENGLEKTFFEKNEKSPQLLNLEKNQQYELIANETNDLIDQLKEKDKVIQILSYQIEHLLKEGKANIQLNTTNNDNRITQNNYYILNAFGNENTDYINKEMVDKFIKDGAYASISKLVKEIHFHPEHPDNFNVMIPNRKQDLAKVFDGQKWVYQKKKPTLEKMSDKAFYILSQHYEGGNKYMDTFKNDYEGEDKNVMKRVHDDTELVVLNNQDVIHNPELEGENDFIDKIKDI